MNVNGRAELSIAKDLFRKLQEIGEDGVGITRDSYGIGESAAFDLMETEAGRHGLDTERDAAGNLVITLQSQNPERPAIACGSHLDSVRHGGNFDGAAGVVAGFLALVRMRADGFIPNRPLRLYALRAEESAAFGIPNLGASALFGGVTVDQLNSLHSVSKRTLREAMREVGADVSRIERGDVLLDPSSLHAWLEVHIEQGPVLTARNLPVAVVTGIRGNVRHRRVTCLGETGHSGAVPLNLRHDAVFAVAELLHCLDLRSRAIIAAGDDFVFTTGILETDSTNHSITRIPETVNFSFDARSQSIGTLDAFHSFFIAECFRLERERGVHFIIDQRIDTPPAIMDANWISRLCKALRKFGVSGEPIPSGAGHDSAIFANVGVPSGMLFIRNQNGSHNPQEAMDLEDFMCAYQVLHLVLTTELKG
ncbi:amidase [Acidiphilium acidophilum DSM 700]|nr:amidase [Acidiphilium acidophilum DSM 700]